MGFNIFFSMYLKFYSSCKRNKGIDGLFFRDIQN